MTHSAVTFEPSNSILHNPGCGIMYLQREKNKEPFGNINPNSWFLKERLTNKIAFSLSWSVIEPHEGEYLWEHPDWEGCFKSWIDNGFKIAIQIRGMGTLGTCYNDGTPQWVFDAGAKYIDESAECYRKTWLLNDTPDKNLPIRYPVYWDGIYLKKVEQLINAFGQRYNNSKNIEFVSIGHIGRWGEMHIAEHNPIEPWIDAGFSLQSYINAHKQIIDIYRKAFSNIALVQELSKPAFGSGDSPCPYNMDDIHEILEHLVENGIHLKNNGMGKSFCQNSSPYLDSDIVAIFRKYRDKVKVVFENLVLPQALKEALDSQISYWHRGGESSGLGICKVEQNIPVTEKRVYSFVPFFREQYSALEKNIELQKNIWRKMAKECGYRILPVKLHIIHKERRKDFTTVITWKNSGCAPCYEDFQVHLGLFDSCGKLCQTLSGKPGIGCGPTAWPKNMLRDDQLNWSLSESFPVGKYKLGLALRRTDGEFISLAIKNTIKDGFYLIDYSFTID